MEPALVFALYSEDHSDAHREFMVLKEVLLGMLQHICPALKTNHVQYEPAQEGRKERVCGNFWKEKPGSRPGSQEHRRRLIRDVATAVQRGRVVFFHVDADDVWAARARCANACEHWLLFLRAVLAVLHRVDASPDIEGLEHAMILAMPFWEIESWAFANVSRLREILAEPGDLASLARWEEDLAQLDELADIKEALSIRDSSGRRRQPGGEARPRHEACDPRRGGDRRSEGAGRRSGRIQRARHGRRHREDHARRTSRGRRRAERGVRAGAARFGPR